MPYDPNFPVDNAIAYADELRAQLNALNDKIDAIPADTAIFQDRLIATTDLTLSADDPAGPTEDSIRLQNNGGKLQAIRRVGGADLDACTLDLTGLDEGAGTPAVQDGDLLRYDATAQTWKPLRGLPYVFSDLQPLALNIGDPPAQADVQAIADRLDEILSRLKTMS